MGAAFRLFLAVLSICACQFPLCWASGENNIAETVAAEQSASLKENTSALLVILNNSGATLMSSNQEVTDNGKEIASLPRSVYKKVLIEAGAHEFRFKAFPGGKRVANLIAEPGTTYYLLVAYSPGRSWGFPFGGDPMTIKLIPEAEALTLLKEMKEQ